MKNEIGRIRLNPEEDGMVKQYINRSSIRQDFQDAISAMKVAIVKK